MICVFSWIVDQMLLKTYNSVEHTSSQEVSKSMKNHLNDLKTVEGIETQTFSIWIYKNFE